jgi:hypothetical protein
LDFSSLFISYIGFITGFSYGPFLTLVPYLFLLNANNADINPYFVFTLPARILFSALIASACSATSLA